MRLLILHAAAHAGPNILKSLQQINDPSLHMDLLCIDLEQQTIIMEQLSSYDVVLFDSMHGKINSAAIGDVLHDYVVIAGKGLVLCLFSNCTSGSQGLKGKFCTGTIHPMQYGPLILAKNKNMPMKPSSFHPLLNHVHELKVKSATRVVAPMSSGAHLVARWDNGDPLVSYKRQYTSQGMVVCINMLATCERQGDITCVGWIDKCDGTYSIIY